MALVAYDYSDSSDVDEESDTTGSGPLDKKVGDESSNTVVQETNSDEAPLKFDHSLKNGTSLFNLLPLPSKQKQSVLEDDDEFLHKKEVLNNVVKPKAKITVPSLSDFKDVEGTIPSAKPKVPNGKKSGLLSILPQPRNTVLISTTTKSFVPHVLTKKPTKTENNRDPLPSHTKNIQPGVNSVPKADLDDSDNDEEIQNDFFSINKPIDIPIVDTPLEIDKNVVPSSASSTNNRENILKSYFKKDTLTKELHTDSHDTGGFSEQYGATQTQASSHENISSGVESSNHNEMILDEEAIVKLCGTRGKRKREEIQIVDINQQEVLADARDWLLKGLMDDTTKRVSSSKRKGDEPTTQQKRKHQITYLAHQAKANEADLQNQWANNRMSKRQTQSKYGF